MHMYTVYMQHYREGMEMTAQRMERLEARIAPETKAIIERAAELTGRSLTAFVVDSARQAAEETIKDYSVITLTMRDTMLLNEALANPPAPNERLRAAARLAEELVGS